MTQKDNRTFDEATWQKGTRALHGAWATDRPKILNMRLAVDGSLVPRPWYEESVDLTTRTDQNAIVFPARYYNSGLAGYFSGYFFADSTSTAVYAHGSGPALATGAGISGMTRDTTVSQISGTAWLVGDHVVTLIGTGSISIVDAGAAIETLFAPGTETITVAGSAIHQGRAFYWGEELSSTGFLTRGNRIWYSDAYDYGTFSSADQFFDVDSSVEGCASIGSNLFIWTVTGDWYILQGRGDPGEGTLNSIGLAPIPASFAVRQDNSLYFLTADKTRTVRVHEGGTIDDITLRDLGFDAAGELPSANGGLPPTASSLHNTIYIPNDDDSGESDALHQWNHVWTEEELAGILTTDKAIVGTNEITSREMLAIYNGTHWVIYRRDIITNQPPESPDTYDEEPDGTIILPRISNPQYPSRVTQVIIDARYWKGTLLPSGAGPFNDPTITVSASDGKGNSHSFTLGPESEDLSTIPDGEGTPIRIVGKPGASGQMAFTPFADITISGIQSLAIEQVRVEFEISNSRNL